MTCGSSKGIIDLESHRMAPGLDACQAALLASSGRNRRGKQINAIGNMIADATERNCWFDDNMEDSHPESVEMGEALGKQKVAAEREIQRTRPIGNPHLAREADASESLEETSFQCLQLVRHFDIHADFHHCLTTRYPHSESWAIHIPLGLMLSRSWVSRSCLY